MPLLSFLISVALLLCGPHVNFIITFALRERAGEASSWSGATSVGIFMQALPPPRHNKKCRLLGIVWWSSGRTRPGSATWSSTPTASIVVQVSQTELVWFLKYVYARAGLCSVSQFYLVNSLFIYFEQARSLLSSLQWTDFAVPPVWSHKLARSRSD